jgi:hypothetical protein
MNTTDKTKFIQALKEEFDAMSKRAEEAVSMTKALELLLKKYTNAGIIYDDDDKTLLDPYDVKMTIKQKVYYALQVIGSGTAQDVADRLVSLEPNYPPRKAFEDSRYHLSKMYDNGKGKITAKSAGKGRKYIYSIKQ